MKDLGVLPTTQHSSLGDNPRDHGPASTGDYNKATGPPYSGYNLLRERLSARISPPPLKRQRTGSSTSSPIPDGRSSTVLPIRLSGPREVKRSSNISSPFLARPVHKAINGDRVSDYSTHSSLFPAPNSSREQRILSRNGTSRNSDGGRTDPSSRTSSTRKRACHVCERSFATNYNPIITCPGCERPYHDSCRKPLLSDGVDPLQWRCSSCLSGNRSRRSSGFATSRVPKSLSALPSAISAGRRNRGSRLDIDQKSLQHPQTNLSHSFKVEGSRDTNRKPPDICSEIQQDLPDPVFLDTCNDTGAGFSGPIRGDVEITPVSPRVPPASSDPIALLDLSVNKVLSSSVKGSSKVEKDRRILKRPNAQMPERTEVPNTPTQHSSQLVIPDSVPQLRLAHNVASVESGSSLTKLQLSEQTASLTALCSVCRKQRILAKNISNSVICRNCRNRSLMKEDGKLEIPETPNATPAYELSARSSPKVALSATAPTLVSGTKGVSTPWFQTELVTLTPKIFKKKVRDDESPCASDLSLGHTNELGSVMGMLQTANITEQVFVRRSDLAMRAHPSQNDMPPKRTPSAGKKGTPSAYPNEIVKKAYAILPLPTIERSVKSTARPSSVEPENDRDNNLVLQHVYTAESGVSGSVSRPLYLKLEGHLDTARSSSASRPPTDTGSESPPVSPFDKSYTIREMAQIALVVANDAYLTTSHITGWIANTFSHLLKGQATWENSLVLELSSNPEFVCQKIVGVQGVVRSWGFADGKERARYERKYAGYHSTSKSASKMLRKSLEAAKSVGIVNHASQASKQILSRRTKARQKTRIPPNAAPHTPTTKLEAPPSAKKALGSPKRGNHSLYMPFERSTPRQPQSSSSFAQSTKRETSFYKVHLQNQELPVKAMKLVEKAKRIAEIKRRPSRKDFFGSDHRLAHVRRYNRQDIHDESDGAWKPNGPKGGKGKSELDSDVQMADSRVSRSLHEVFDLPSDAIPMNEGQTELAFRDGTLINGRLPRPRQIYKVGKLFGGELTIRTS